MDRRPLRPLCSSEDGLEQLGGPDAHLTRDLPADSRTSVASGISWRARRWIHVLTLVDAGVGDGGCRWRSTPPKEMTSAVVIVGLLFHSAVGVLRAASSWKWPSILICSSGFIRAGVLAAGGPVAPIEVCPVPFVNHLSGQRSWKRCCFLRNRRRPQGSAREQECFLKVARGSVDVLAVLR